MKFSEVFSVTNTSDDDWFDPILNIDTKLFIDPFLVFSTETGIFIGSHDEIISFFNNVFLLVAESRGNPNSVPWKKAENLLRIREVSELCLGYTKFGVRGSAAGSKLALDMTEAIYEVIKRGKKEISHFEEIGIIKEGIGADRISDITAAILKQKLIQYTQSACIKHKIPLVRKKFIQGYFNKEFLNWMPVDADLPMNPYSNKAILLTPKNHLRQLPTINLDGFWDYCYHNENESIRNDFSYDIQKNVDKSTIIEFARKHPEIREKYLEITEALPPDPYNFTIDNKGFIRWYNASRDYSKSHPLPLPIDSIDTFLEAIKKLIDEFGNYIENNKGWSLLWNDNGKPKSEDAAQNLFYGIVTHYCRANNIDISREANIGRGPVDFKVSQGFSLRALLELKLAKNSKFWNGLERQLPKYMLAEGIDIGYFVIIMFNEKDYNRLSKLQEKVESVNKKTRYLISSVAIDASRNPPSASKL
jgi:hypothetical protein